MKHMYFPGEVISVDLGDVSQVQGHEQAKNRPCIVIKSFSHLKLVIILPATSTPNSSYTTIKILKGEGGLKNDSYVLCHQIRCVSFDRITNAWGKLNNRDLLKIKTTLSDTLDL